MTMMTYNVVSPDDNSEAERPATRKGLNIINFDKIAFTSRRVPS